VSDRYWRLAPEGGSTGDPLSPPTLALGWTPHELRFVAQGEPPYTVAFGSAAVGSPGSLLATLDEAKLDGMRVPATASEVFDLGGTARLRTSPWRIWVLWGFWWVRSSCSAGWCGAWSVSWVPVPWIPGVD